MPSLMPTGKQQYFYPGTPLPLIGGKLYTYAAGTSTPKPTYQDAAGTTPNTNPITLDSSGSALIYWDGAYKIVLKDALGNTVYTVDNYNTDPNGVLQLFTAAGAAHLGVADGYRSVQDKLNEHKSVEDFGPTCQGNDDTAVVQRAINAAVGVLEFTGPNYRIDGQLVWKTGVIYQGRGVDILGGGGTKITFNGTTDASKIVNPLNSSNPVGIVFRDLYFYAPNLTRTSAILFDTGTTYGHVHRCRFYSSGVGIILDQSELWDIERSSFLLASEDGAGIWIVNGPDKQAGSQPYFTNRISVHNCDFNGSGDPGTTSVGIYDDGGVAHSFTDNNFNACGSHIVIVGVNGAKVDGGEFEGSVQQSIICGTTKRLGGAGGKSPVVSINRVYVYNGSNQPAVAMVAGAVGKLDLTNNVISTPGDPTSGLAVSCDEINARGNAQVGTGAGDTLLNNYFDLHPAPCDWFASNASPVLGNGQNVASYSRRGKIVTFRQRIVFGSTTNAGNGSYLFPLPFPADTAGFAQLGTAWFAVVGTSYYAGTARVTVDGRNVELFVSAPNDVGSATPGAWTPNSVIEFQISYLTAAPI